MLKNSRPWFFGYAALITTVSIHGPIPLGFANVIDRVPAGIGNVTDAFAQQLTAQSKSSQTPATQRRHRTTGAHAPSVVAHRQTELIERQTRVMTILSIDGDWSVGFSNLIDRVPAGTVIVTSFV